MAALPGWRRHERLCRRRASQVYQNPNPFEDCPFPVKLTVCGLPEALSATESLAWRVPFAVGLNVTLMVQWALAERLAGQLLLSLKSPLFVPVMLIPVMVSGALPELVSVTVCEELVEPTFSFPKLMLVGLSVTAGTVPVPFKLTVCGLPVALSEILTEAVRLPPAVGLKVTSIVQLAFADKLAGQLLVWLKSLISAPVMVMPLMVSEAFPVLVRVTG
jgi:hypothetical protein